MQKLIILDRDGVINQDSDDFIKSTDEFVPIPGSLEAIARLCKGGYSVMVATNQSGIARQLFSVDILAAMHEKLQLLLAPLGGQIDGFYYCPHGPDEGCKCRKPASGMLEEAQKTFDISMEESWMIGDKESDMLAAKNAGVNKRILVSQYLDSDEASYCVKRVDEIVGLID